MKEIVISSSVLILSLLGLRLLFARKVSRRLIYSAWALVALRLLIPVQIGQMDFSVLTLAQPLTQSVSEFAKLPVAGRTEQEAHKQVITSYIEENPEAFVPLVQDRIQQATEEYYSPEQIADMIGKTFPGSSAFAPEVREQVSREIAQQTTSTSLGQILTVIWLAGAGAMGAWLMIVNLRHQRELQQEAEPLEWDSPIPVYMSDEAQSPCLAGILRPRIYLPPHSLQTEEMRLHVITHELAHYRQWDHVWNLLRCLCLCIYWFHPLVWVAVYVSRRDCELACDEAALEQLGPEQRIAYGKTLLEVVRHRAYPSDWLQTATSMTETKRQLKERVNFIAKRPKLSFVAAVGMVLVCAIVTGCVAAGPKAEKETDAKTYIAIKPVDDRLAVIYNDQLILTNYRLQVDVTPRFSLDGESAACLLRVGPLLLIHDGKVEQIADSVKSYSLSVSGDAVAFWIDEEKAANGSLESGLYLYQKATGQCSRVHAGTDGYVQSYALSPDGQTLAFTLTKGQNDNSDSRMLVYREGAGIVRTDHLQTTYRLISIDNSAQIIYGYSLSRYIYSIDPQGELLKLGRINPPEWEYSHNAYDPHGYLYSNPEHTDLMFFGSSGFLSRQGKAAEQVLESKLTAAQAVVPALSVCHDDRVTITCDTTQLNTIPLRTTSGLYCATSQGQYIDVTRSIMSTDLLWLDPAGRYLYYESRENGERFVYRVDLQHEFQPRRLAQTEKSFAVSYDGESLYCVTGFVDDRQEGVIKNTYVLKRIHAADGTVEAEIEIKEPQMLYLSENGQVFFLTYHLGERQLYTVNKRNEPELVLGNVRKFTQERCGMLYVETNEDAYYIIRDGELIRLQISAME